MLNIILRTHNRPIKFKRMIDCIENQTFKDFKLYISVDNDETEKYVRESGYDFIRFNPDLNIPVFYNLYFNDLYEKIDSGWIWSVDDDDLIADENVFQLIHDSCIDENKIYIFKFHNKHARCIRPSRFFGEKIEIGNIGTPNFVVNKKYCCESKWEPNHLSDGLYISNLVKKIGLENVCWIDKVIYIVEKANKGL